MSLAKFRQSLLLLPELSPSALFEAYSEDAAALDTGLGFERVHNPARDAQADTARKIATKLTVGGLAGAVSRTCTAPLDRLRSIMQASKPGAAPRGLAATVGDVWKENGVKAFFRGNGANMLKVAPEQASKFFCFEAINKIV